jgi:hypothetical protein
MSDTQVRKVVAISIAALLILLTTLQARSQEAAEEQLEIASIDISNYPNIVLNLIVTNGKGEVLFDITNFVLSEDGKPITEFSARQVSEGVDLIVVIDANTSIENRDEANGLSRREKVRDSVVRYANHLMDPQEQDRVSIIVPGGGKGRFLETANMSFPNEVINAINFYETGQLGDTPLNTMMLQALERAESDREAGRFQVILLFTDGARLAEQLDYNVLTTQALARDVAIYGAILGSRADPEEVANVALLTDATGGNMVHLPDAFGTDPLYQEIKARAIQTQIDYHSNLNNSGQHTIRAELGESSAEASVELIVEPPTITLEVDNSRPIRRVATNANTPLEEMEPGSQPLVAQVRWPDGYPRTLSNATLLIDGTEVPLIGPVLDAGGMLTFDWDLRTMGAGTYDLQVQVVDELGLIGLSKPLALAIEVEQPQPVPTPLTQIEPTVEPTPEPVIESEPRPAILANDLPLIGGGLAALLLLALLIVVGVVAIRRRRQTGPDLEPPALAPIASQPSQVDQFDPYATYALTPEFASGEESGAYLEALENAPEHQTLIPLSGGNVTLGRDARLVQIPFNERSVSRLHARIIETNGAYRIYDEGSASGTYVNFERISLTPRILNDKDDVHFGRVHLRFHLASSLTDRHVTQRLDSAAFAPENDDENETTFMNLPE